MIKEDLAFEDPHAYFQDFEKEIGVERAKYEPVDTAWAREIKARLKDDLGYKAKRLPGMVRAFKREYFGEDSPDPELDQRTIDAVSILVEFEEDPELPPGLLLDRGVKSVYVRVLKHRLRLLGFFNPENSPSTPRFDEETEEAVIKFKKAFGLAVNPQAPGRVNGKLFKLMGNPYALNRKFLEITEKKVTVVQTKGDVSNYPWIWRNYFKVFQDGKRISTKKGHLVDPKPTKKNDTGVRLLQLWMWILSYYHEEATGAFNRSTARAICQFLRENGYNQAKYLIGRRKLPRKYIFIAPAVFEKLGTERPDEETVKENESKLFDKIHSEINDDKKSELQIFLEKFWNKFILFDRRVYQGVKSTVVWVNRAIRSRCCVGQ
jgi:peptidoglycan hydrolase-like protein with peptidoglycan-binding domain